MSDLAKPSVLALADARHARFEGFYRGEYLAALRLAWLLTGSRAAAEDVVHDAMTAVYRSYERIDRPAAYLRRAVINGARTWQRDERRQRERVELVLDRLPAALGRSDGALLEAIGGLPYRQRVVVVARYWGGWTEAEIADSLGCRRGTVKSLASRALEHLRKEVEP